MSDSEVVILPNLMMMTLILSEESLARNRHTHTQTHTDTDTQKHTETRVGYFP